MSDWSNIGSTLVGEEQGGSGTQNTTEVDWFSNENDIFIGGGSTLLVDPRDVRRAETAPSVLTMFSADGTLCVGGSLEAEVAPGEEYRYTQEYHTLYYSKYPRDPRMLVPLRSRAMVGKRGAETLLPGRGIGALPTDEGRIPSTGDGGYNSQDTPGTATTIEEKEKGAAFAKSVLESISHKQAKQKQQHEEEEDEHHQTISSVMTGQNSSNQPIDGNSANTTPGEGFLQFTMDNKMGDDPALHHQDSLTMRSVRLGGTAARRQQRDGTNRNFQNGSTKNNTRKSINGGDSGNVKSSRDEFAPIRDFLDGTRTDFSFDDIKGFVVSLSKDQDGSRFIQRLLDEENNIEPIFLEVLPNTCELMIDVFGNYVLQKLLDVLPMESEMSEQLMEKVRGRLKEYSFQMYGCRVIQKFLERASPESRKEMLLELKDSLVECVFDQNANHVAQKIIEVMPEKTQFITEDFMPRLKALSRHPYGCRVLQCVFEKCSPVPEVNIRPILEAVFENVHEFVMDQYGNYVVQHAMLNAPEDLRRRFVELLIPHVYALSCSKFASNVAEKTIVKANEEELQRIVETLTRPLGSTEDGNYLVLMMQDPYANYVVQRLLQQVNKPQQQHIAEQTRPHIMNIRRSVYGQHLVQKMESMGMFSCVEGTLLFNNNNNNPPHYREPSNNLGGRGTGKKNRLGAGGRGGGSNSSTRSRSTPHNNNLIPNERPPASGMHYNNNNNNNNINKKSQGGAAMTVAGRGMLPLTATGSSYGYSYMATPPDIMLAPPQQQQQQQMVAPSLTIGGQPCYPGMMPPPLQQQQQHQQQSFTLQGQSDNYNTMDMGVAPQQHQQQHNIHKGNDVYTANTFYTNGNGLMGHPQNDAWGQPFQPFSQSMPQTMLYGNNTPNTYSDLNPVFQQGRYNPVNLPQPLSMQYQ